MTAVLCTIHFKFFIITITTIKLTSLLRSIEPRSSVVITASYITVGAKGLPGTTGTRGETGNTGATGFTGVIGDTGATGATGATGIAGSSPQPGVPGLRGPPGYRGPSGPHGMAVSVLSLCLFIFIYKNICINTKYQ